MGKKSVGHKKEPSMARKGKTDDPDAREEIIQSETPAITPHMVEEIKEIDEDEDEAEEEEAPARKTKRFQDKGKKPMTTPEKEKQTGVGEEEDEEEESDEEEEQEPSVRRQEKEEGTDEQQNLFPSFNLLSKFLFDFKTTVTNNYAATQDLFLLVAEQQQLITSMLVDIQSLRKDNERLLNESAERRDAYKCLVQNANDMFEKQTEVQSEVLKLEEVKKEYLCANIQSHKRYWSYVKERDNVLMRNWQRSFGGDALPVFPDIFADLERVEKELAQKAAAEPVTKEGNK